MRAWRAGILTALTLGPASACVLFDGPSDYPPRDGGSSDVAAIDTGPEAAGGDAGDGAATTDARIGTEAGGDASSNDASPSGDAKPDGPSCAAVGAVCQISAECCSLDCSSSTKKCR